MEGWRYVCTSDFDHIIDREVVLQQLDCKTGGIVRYESLILYLFLTDTDSSYVTNEYILK